MVETGSAVTVRAYRRGDAAAAFAVYRAAILRTASADYEPAQVMAWAGPEEVDLPRWDARRLEAHTVVAVARGQVVGFADHLDDGLLDMLFVHPDHGRRGVARLLVDAVKRSAVQAGVSTLRTYASRTARPAFERFGFEVVAARPDNAVGGQTVPNYEMRCDLDSGGS